MRLARALRRFRADPDGLGRWTLRQARCGRSLRAPTVFDNVWTGCLYNWAVKFDWDPAKNDANIAKHGIDFYDAVRVFEGPLLEYPDNRRDYGEVRMIAYGAIDEREIVLVYTNRGARCRIISARRAHRNEREAYRKAYPRNPSARQD